MSVIEHELRGRWRIGEIALWTGASLVAICAHVGAVAWALQEPPTVMADSPPPAIMIELAPTPEAVETEDTNVAPDQTVSENVQSQTVEPVKDPTPEVTPEPTETAEEETPEEIEKPEETAEVKPDEKVEDADPVEEQILAQLDKVEVPVPVFRPKPPEKKEVEKEKPRKKAERPKRKKPAPVSRQADQAQAQVRESSRNAASASSSGSGSSMSPAKWQSRLMSHLERRKKYPSGARSRGETGVAYVRFRIDDAGNVLSASLARSSGFPELDAEVIALVRRASPVPQPPPGVNKTVIAPVRFSVR
ncbi:energy transducer TonB family protein [Phyllobacterium sp. K27]